MFRFIGKVVKYSIIGFFGIVVFAMFMAIVFSGDDSPDRAQTVAKQEAKPRTPPPPKDNSILAYGVSKDAIKPYLKAPSTAKFPSIVWNRSDISIRNLGDQKYRVRAYVDAQNAFGAMIRNNYSVTVQFFDDGNRYRTSDVSID